MPRADVRRWWSGDVIRLGGLVAAGRTSDVYEYGAGSVIKVPRPSVPESWAAREAHYTSAVHALGAPAPAVRDVVCVDGRDAIVFERVDGRSLWQHVADEPDRAAAHGRVLADVHRQIFSVGLPLDVEGLVDRMRLKLDAAEVLTEDERNAAKRTVDGLPRGAALLHGDLHPGNVLMSERGPVAIDWFDAAIGHPVADVVRSSLLLRDFGRERPHLPGASAAVLTRLHDGYVEAMASCVAAPADVVGAWEGVVAASRLAERAEADESSLLTLWRDSRQRGPTPAVVPLIER